MASGATYAFDVIAHVGVETYLRGRSLQDIQEELADRRPAIDVPLSTLWDQQQKFLFYLGCLHQQAGPRLREFLAQHGPVTWLLDGTTEPETAVFLGVEEASHGLFLGSWKIATENVEYIAPCLQQAADSYGQPDRVLHDLSPASNSCSTAAWSRFPPSWPKSAATPAVLTLGVVVVAHACPANCPAASSAKITSSTVSWTSVSVPAKLTLAGPPERSWQLPCQPHFGTMGSHRGLFSGRRYRG